MSPNETEITIDDGRHTDVFLLTLADPMVIGSRIRTRGMLLTQLRCEGVDVTWLWETIKVANIDESEADVLANEIADAWLDAHRLLEGTERLRVQVRRYDHTVTVRRNADRVAQERPG